MTITATTMATEIQAKITALVSPVAPRLIFKYAANSQGLGLDLSNLEAVLNNAILLVDNATSDFDLMALTSAKIAIESNIVVPQPFTQRGVNSQGIVIISPVDMSTAKVTLLSTIAMYKSGSGTSVLTRSVYIELISPTELQISGAGFSVSWEVSDNA